MACAALGKIESHLKTEECPKCKLRTLHQAGRLKKIKEADEEKKKNENEKNEYKKSPPTARKPRMEKKKENEKDESKESPPVARKLRSEDKRGY